MRSGNIHHLRHAVKGPRRPSLSPAIAEELQSATHEAAMHGDCEALGVLIEAGATLTSLNVHGETLLLQTVASRNAKAVEMILGHGFQVRM